MKKDSNKNKGLKEEFSDKNIQAIPEIDPAKLYRFRSNGKNKIMPKDAEYELTGEIALILIKKGLGDLI
jgi:hypothetical protein